MYQTPFETYERNIRMHMARLLGPGGFDPARDIAAITINRWPHGYATGVNYLFDPEVPEDDLPFVKARKRFGRITIANTDAVGICLTQAAFDQAYRAVKPSSTRGRWRTGTARRRRGAEAHAASCARRCGTGIGAW